MHLVKGLFILTVMCEQENGAACILRSFHNHSNYEGVFTEKRHRRRYRLIMDLLWTQLLSEE